MTTNTATIPASNAQKIDSGVPWALQWLVNFFSSQGLTVVLLLFLGLLTFLGTLEQQYSGLYDVQKRYFESKYLLVDLGIVVLPLPGGMLVQGLLFINILVGGIVRMKKSNVGILITHVGIAFLLFSGFWKHKFSQEGHVTLYENESAKHYESYYTWEISISRQLEDGKYEEYVIPHENLVDATGSEKVTLFSSELPFDLEVHRFMRNASPEGFDGMKDPGVPVVDGVYLGELRPEKESEHNRAGIYADVVVKKTGQRHEGVLWGFDFHKATRRQAANWAVEVDGTEWLIDLRHTRFPMPFTVTLDKFTKEEHARTTMPRVFSSDVSVAQVDDNRKIKIEMNEPLRDEGLVLYQSGWGPQTAEPGDPLFSTLSVVRNRADHWPEYSCWIIAVGLLIHFIKKLWKYIQVEVAKA